MFEVSQKQENKENLPCQCDSDLENPEKGNSWLPASKGAGPLQAGIEGAFAWSVLAAEFLLFSLTKVLGISVHGLARNPANFYHKRGDGTIPALALTGLWKTQPLKQRSDIDVTVWIEP